LKPIGRDTPPIPAPSTDRRNRIDRRCLLQALAIASVTGLAGCFDGDDDNASDDPADDSSDDTADDDGDPGDEDADNTPADHTADDGGDDDSTDDSGDSDDDTTADDDSDDDDTGEADDTAEPETAEITVTVIDDADTPIEDVSLTFVPDSEGTDDSGELTGETDADGTYTDTIEQGEYTIEAVHPDFEMGEEEYVHDGPGEITVGLKLEGGGETTEMTVTVVDEDGEPVEGAAVDLQPYDEPGEPAEGETDADGTYSASLDEVLYTIYVTHPDYEAHERVINLPRDAEITVELEAERDSWELTVRVLDPNENPVEGATVRFVGSEDDPEYDSVPTGETDADGVLAETLREDTYFLEVDHDEYGSAGVEHDHDEPSEVTIELEEL
jgi:protocatechuate 3,4-dioxygenase beta subunit